MNWAQERGRTSVESLWTQRKVQARVSRKNSGPWSNRCGKACQKNHCHYMTAMTAMTGMVNLFISPTWWILWVYVFFFKSTWSTFWICLILFDPFWSFLRLTVNCGSSTIGNGMDVRNLIAGFTGLGDGRPSPGWQRRMIGNKVLRDLWHRMRLTTKSPCRRIFQQVETTGGLMNPWAGKEAW